MADAGKFAAEILRHLEPAIRDIVRDEVERYAGVAVDRALTYHRIKEAGRG